MHVRFALCLLFAVVVGVPAPAVAQAPGAAGIRGRVVDPQQRGVAASVALVQASTGVERETEADAAGFFAFATVPPGEFHLRVAAPGFADARIDGLRIEVGRSVEITVQLQIAALEERVTVAGGAGSVDVLGSVVGSVVSFDEIQSLPLNGRNFLELALLAPGNAPAPTFDPTKAHSVIVSSAGQAGRGGNITIDGMDNNDDVVGGPLQNVPQDAVQEFQVATNRFTAELGRSASSVINVVTRAGGDRVSGSGALFLRDGRWQAQPELGRDGGPELPFDRQQVAAALGGPLRRQRIFGFGALEVRNQDGGVLTGTRDPAARTIRQALAPAPLDDVLGMVRIDWRAARTDDVSVRYAVQREDDIAASILERPIGSASQRQQSHNRIDAISGSWTRMLSPAAVSAFSLGFSRFDNRIVPLQPGVQLTFPSLQDGSSFRVPQATVQRRWQVSEAVTIAAGAHQWKFGGQLQRIDARFDLGVFRDGRIELVEDFPAFDRNGDGRVDDDDLLFAVTLRSGRPDRDLIIDDADNVHAAAYVQDDWRVHPRLTLNLGLRYEIDSDVNNVSRAAALNPIVAAFVTGPRRRDANNWGPRLGFNWSAADARTSIRGGYGLYFDRVTLQVQSLERGLDGRALPIEVRAGNLFFVDPATGRIPPFAPTVSRPFTGFIIPGAGASGIHLIDARLQNPQVHQASIGVERQLGDRHVVRADAVHNHGTHFIIGRTVGAVFNPVVGGPDRVVRLESAAETDYHALLVEVERRFSGRFGYRAAYTLSKAFNYANDDQIPFLNGPIDPDNLRREYGPAANDRRHRLVLSGAADIGGGFRVAGLWTIASGVPMDILMPGGQSRVPILQRNAGGRLFKSAAELNRFIADVNARGGIGGELLPLVSETARFSDSFNALDLRVSRAFVAGRARAEVIVELFNVFDTMNILGTSTLNYSGFANVLARESNVPGTPGYLRSPTFGTPVSTAGGVFGSGGPRALQLGVRVTF